MAFDRRDHSSPYEYDYKRMKIRVWLGGEDIWIKGKYEICDVCQGRGHHVNPSIDSHGISGEEMAELGEDFREDYMSGVYDVPCAEGCDNGKRLVPDERNCTYAQMRAYDDTYADAAECWAIDAAERRAFGG